MNTSKYSRRLFSHIIAGGTLSLTAGLALTESLEAVERRTRFAIDSIRNRPNNATRLGEFSNVQNYMHRVRTQHGVVYSNTSADEALAVSQMFTRVWQQSEQLADQFTNVHRIPRDPNTPDFEVGPVSVFVDRRPQLRHGGQPSTLHVVGNATMIYLNVAPGQAPPLQEQTVRLRLATAHAFLAESKLGEVLPTWAVDGMAGYVAGLDLEDNATVSTEQNNLPRFLGENRRNHRDVWPAQFGLSGEEQDAIKRFQFLMEGFDGRFAPELLGSLAQTSARRLPYDKAQVIRRRIGRIGVQAPFLDSPTPPTTIDGLARKTQGQYQQWQQEPAAGLPVIEELEGLTEQQQVQQREMAWLLKLLDRFGESTQRGLASQIREFKDGEAHELPIARAVNHFTVYDLQRKLANTTWATRDLEGRLVLSTGGQALISTVGRLARTYASEMDTTGLRTVSRRIDGERTLQAWLANNPDNRYRPLARFAMLDSSAQNETGN